MSRTVVVAYIALGANLDDPVRQVRQAIDRLQTVPQTRLAAASSLWRTAPVGGALVAGQPDYINAVAMLETALDADTLLQHLQAIEREAGRVRDADRPMASRPLDLDLLLYGTERIATAQLTVPHPRMHERAFVLAPLAELAPELALEDHGPVTALLARIGDQPIAKL
jgi:2-amino-4-hydroxy-6-hydroxymethyldihydropteridine diphosphokinase